MGKKDLFAKEILLGPKEYPIKIQIKTFKGKKYLDIRKWFLDRSINEVVPTKKGIMLSDYQFNDVFETVGKEKELINNLVPSPSLFSALLLWGKYDNLEDNINYLNSLWENKENIVK